MEFNRDNQIEEMANDLENHTCMSQYQAEIASRMLYAKGYRKVSEVAEEIFAEIENAHEECIHIDTSTNIGYLLQTKFEHKLAELKKKYTEEGK